MNCRLESSRNESRAAIGQCIIGNWMDIQIRKWWCCRFGFRAEWRQAGSSAAVSCPPCCALRCSFCASCCLHFAFCVAKGVRLRCTSCVRIGPLGPCNMPLYPARGQQCPLHCLLDGPPSSPFRVAFSFSPYPPRSILTCFSLWSFTTTCCLPPVTLSRSLVLSVPACPAPGQPCDLSRNASCQMPFFCSPIMGGIQLDTRAVLRVSPFCFDCVSSTPLSARPHFL